MNINRLNARTVTTLVKPGRHADGAGLYLNVTDRGAKSWIFMWKRKGKRVELGLGSFKSVPLAQARQKATEAREALAQGIEPQAILKPQQAPKVPMFGDVFSDHITRMEKSWSNEKHADQWRMTRNVICKPLLNRPVDSITTDDVLQILQPIWTTKAETASRVRGRIETVLAAATVFGYRKGENPAQWRNHLERLLPKRSKLTRGHHKALPYRDAREFFERLHRRPSVSAWCLEFLILTAARSGDAMGATWDEIDLNAKLWTIPATRMKAKKEHRVPLSEAAISVLKKVKELRTSEFIFPGLKKKRLSVTALQMLVRDINPDITVHGFRSTFRDWCGEETDFAWEIAEAALAHRVGNETERAYRRGDALEKRRAMMTAWAIYCCKSA